MPTLPPLDHRWMLEEEDSLRLRETHPDLWPSPGTSCITCLFHAKPDRARTFRWWNADHTEVVDWECDCIAQWILHRKLLHHGINKRYQRLGWMDTIGVGTATADATHDYLAHSDQYIERGMNLIYHSPDAGTGKTLMLMLLAKGLLGKGTDVYMAQMNSIVEMYTSGWRSAEEKAYFERRVMNAGVLGIDDLGKEAGQNRVDFIDRLLDRVLRHRTASDKPTIITTNLTRDQLEAGYNRYVASLLTETCAFAETSGVDWRPQSRARMLKEQEQGLSRPVMLG